MTYKEFFTAITTYYGDYKNNFIEDVVYEWIIKNLNETDLESHYKKLLSSYSNQYKTPPDISVLSRLFKAGAQVQAEHAWQSLFRKSAITDVLITDSYAHACVAGYGSWDEFCQSRDNYTELTHKDFIKRYCMFYESGYQYHPCVLRGALSQIYGDSMENVKVLVIGDQDRGRELLESSGETVKTISDLTESITKNIAVE